MRMTFAAHYLASRDVREAKYFPFHSISTAQGLRNCYKVLKFAVPTNDKIIVRKKLAQFVNEMSTQKQLRWDKGSPKLLEMLNVALLRVWCMTKLSLTFVLSWY